jgi:hypothetical protein
MREVVPIFKAKREIKEKLRDARREQWRTIKRRKTFIRAIKSKSKANSIPSIMKRLTVGLTHLLNSSRY